jgi:hypothetical protein
MLGSTYLLDVSGWPKRMRVICRNERPTPALNATASGTADPMPVSLMAVSRLSVLRH